MSEVNLEPQFPQGKKLDTEQTGEVLTRKPRRVRLPGFVVEETGLGDAVKRLTASMGIRPCGACLRRAQTLNSWVVRIPARAQPAASTRGGSRFWARNGQCCYGQQEQSGCCQRGWIGGRYTK